jgi:cytoskeleton protein RodZ
MDVGAALRDAREQRGLSLEELSRTTKIRVATLRALECNQIDTLPGGIFIRGFLKAYARQVGLDVADTVQRYLAQFEPRVGAAAPIKTGGTRSESTRLVHSDADINDSTTLGASLRLLVVGLALAIGVTGYVAVRGSRTPTPARENVAEAPAGESRSPSAASPAAETATSGIHEGYAPAGQAQSVVHLDIRTLGPCWVSATADGVSVVYQLMQAGERRAIEARDEVVLRVGDPAAFTYLINDVGGRSVGRAGQPVTVRITPQNYREFISP